MLSNKAFTSERSLMLRLDSAIAAARGAGRLILNKDIQNINIESKGLNDIVTEMDSATERFIINHLKIRFPNDNFFGEEMGESINGNGGRWIIDPIDGTDNYVHNIPNFTISIGYENMDGVLSLGVVYNPSQDEMFSAAKGYGSFLNGNPIHVSRVDNSKLALSITSPPFRIHNKLPLYLKIMESILVQTTDIRDLGSAALSLCYVACGRVDAYYEFGLKYYDFAAGLVILEEAGGSHSSFLESENLLIDGNIIATNGSLQNWYSKEIGKLLQG